LHARGRADDAATTLSALIADYPSSRWQVEAHISLGEQLFERHDPAAARDHYQQAVPAAKGEAAWYARYKIAWCDIELGDLLHALDEFIEVARSTADDTLVLAARNDVVRVLLLLDPAPSLDEVRMRIGQAADDPDIAATMLETYNQQRASGSR
jgi:hypothetical protein